MPWSVWSGDIYGESKNKGNWRAQSNGCVCGKHCVHVLETICFTDHHRICSSCTVSLVCHEWVAKRICLPDRFKSLDFPDRHWYNVVHRIGNGRISLPARSNGKPSEVITLRIINQSLLTKPSTCRGFFLC